MTWIDHAKRSKWLFDFGSEKNDWKNEQGAEIFQIIFLNRFENDITVTTTYLDSTVVPAYSNKTP